MNTEIFKHFITWDGFERACHFIANKIESNTDYPGMKYTNIFPIMKNGLPIAERLSRILNLPICYILGENSLIVDDLIDSGKTLSQYPNNDKAVLYVKNNKEKEVTYYADKIDKWIVLPWEKEEDIHDTVIRQLEYIGEDVSREGLKETPKRVVKSWKELYAGYNMDVYDIFKTFKEGACDELVLLKDIEFYSTCEHHMLPFFGKIHIGYIPNKKVIGISKLARIVEVFARRLQIQERFVTQIAECINKYLEPIGVMVVAEAQHFCMTSRGIKKINSKMITSSIIGVFRDDMKAREEFLDLIRRS